MLISLLLILSFNIRVPLVSVCVHTECNNGNRVNSLSKEKSSLSMRMGIQQ